MILAVKIKELSIEMKKITQERVPKQKDTIEEISDDFLLPLVLDCLNMKIENKGEVFSVKFPHDKIRTHHIVSRLFKCLRSKDQGNNFFNFLYKFLM